ncbi:hypothetical protein CQ12_11050 [Bradyrhizobium jicamae]|uniref:Uncharacterized protein n=1 Tax=Bradyrhizobium jicamae TaxID=280332 RepID=A0A0R3M2Z3_9BRAD|nr:hypothetical protein CQ12_11050 [Bradyrhizobium jicamae]
MNARLPTTSRFSPRIRRDGSAMRSVRHEAAAPIDEEAKSAAAGGSRSPAEAVKHEARRFAPAGNNSKSRPSDHRGGSCRNCRFVTDSIA